MNQETIKNVKFYLVMAILFLSVISGIVWLEMKVQNNWDRYEQKVFAEYR